MRMRLKISGLILIAVLLTFNPAAADTDCSGSIDIVDALLIAQFYVGLINQFCN